LNCACTGACFYSVDNYTFRFCENVARVLVLVMVTVYSNEAFLYDNRKFLVYHISIVAEGI